MDKPKLNVILDSRRQEKYQPLIDELNRQQITNFELWPCIMYPNVVQSINASHKMIVQRAKDEGLKECCIGEDDLMFPSENGWNWFLENKPGRYDIYAGCNYLASTPPEKPGLIRVDCIVGFHLYMVHEKYYDTFLSTKDDDHIDTAQKGKEMYVVWPFPALQRPGYSINNSTIVNYNSIFSDRPENIYK
jgi:hypothetical protein